MKQDFDQCFWAFMLIVSSSSLTIVLLIDVGVNKYESGCMCIHIVHFYSLLKTRNLGWLTVVYGTSGIHISCLIMYVIFLCNNKCLVCSNVRLFYSQILPLCLSPLDFGKWKLQSKLKSKCHYMLSCI